MRLSTAILTTAVIGLIKQTAGASPILWSGNDHYYQLVSPSAGITWTDAETAASAATYLGLKGHLATISSQAEFNFIVANFPTNFTWIGFYDPIGAAHGPDGGEGSGSQHAANFVWADGEPVSYTAWLPNEPNNAASEGENYTWYEQRNGVWGWNDYQNFAAAVTGASPSPPISYLIEYSVPEAGTRVLIAVSGLGLLLRERRIRPSLGY
jgi:hypothetical protein